MTLVDAFNLFFAVVPADSRELRDSASRLRYEVYCRELHYEAPEDHPDELESDVYDEDSRHCLLRHRPSGEFAGCVRLVLNQADGIRRPLPFERQCGSGLWHTIIEPDRLPRGSFGEISRLAVVARFRRRAGEQGSAHGLSDAVDAPSSDERRVFPHIALGLYLAAAALGLRHGLDIVFVMMEPRLARHMQRYGILFTQAGDVIDYHGQRGPFFITREGLYGNLKPEVRQLLDRIHRDVGGSADPDRAGEGSL